MPYRSREERRAYDREYFRVRYQYDRVFREHRQSWRRRRREVITVTIPGTPDACLSLNGRAHWRVKAKHAKAYRQTACLAAKVVPIAEPLRGAVKIHLEFGWEKGRKQMDFDNAVGLAKPAVDGLVDAGLMSDDRYVVGITLDQKRDPAGVGYLAVTIEQA